MHNRIKTIRASKGMNQADFAKALGIGQSTLAMMEVGKRDILDRHIKTICSVFGVNEDWLRTGEGAMFVNDDNVLLSQLAKQYDLDDFSCKFIETFVSLPKAHRGVIMSFARTLASAASDTEFSTEIAPAPVVDDALTNAEIDTEVDNYRKQLELEKSAAEKSSALPGAKEA